MAQRHRIALRVPMTVHPRDGSPLQTFFNVFLEHSDEDNERAVFIRDELIIPDVKTHRCSQVRAIVIVEDGPLASLLRDAETPAHTQWNQETGNFKHKYKYGAGAIKFVRLSVPELLRIINQSEQQPDPSITIDFFSIPVQPDDEESVPSRRRKPKQRPGGEPIDALPIPQPKPRRFRIDKLRGGFAIRAGDPQAPLPPFIDIRLAYDVRRGNPLKKYHEADFEVGQLPIRFMDAQQSGVEVKSASGNRMLVAVEQPGFNFEVTGFDVDRDLYVKAEVKEAADVD
jgi:hypothetical protein